MKNPHSAWHFANDEARQELGGDPLQLLTDAETVKSNAVRKVYRSGSYYIKLDRRAGRSFCGEFNAALFCQREGIPVVEHLAWGKSSEGALLITRAADGFEEAASLFKTRQSWELYVSFAEFLCKIFDSKVYHPDFHGGNILIAPAGGQCCLVDLHGVRRRTFFDRLFRMGLMTRCIMELRNCCSDGEMLELIERCGIHRGKEFFKRSLARENRYLAELFPKRRKQILSGYFKYTREEGAKLIDITATEGELEEAREVLLPEGEELFLFHFFLTFAKIPHRRVLGFDLKTGAVLLENELPVCYRSTTSGEELCRRLEFNGVESTPEDFRDGYLYNLVEVFRKR